MKIGIIGAGFAGLASAKVLTDLGHDVTVYEKAPDVGGVWSRTRRYPGLRTQNNKGTYCLSDLPMPADYPEWPSSEQVQAYLEKYAERFDVTRRLRLDTEVTGAEPAAEGGWDITTADDTDHVDHLVIASGIFSRPFVPDFDGAEVLQRLGGQILPAGELHGLDQVRDKNVIVVGYGKSACDVAVEVSKIAASTTVVARELLWKLPRMLKGVLNYKYLMLTRLGESLFPYQHLAGFEKVLHAGGSRIANSMLGSVEKVSTKQLGLESLGLVPRGTFGDIARSTVSLASEGFFEQATAGAIDVHRDAEIRRFVERETGAYAELSDGTAVPVDVVIAATGWLQDIPFLPEGVKSKLFDDNGDFLLYRQIHPINVPDLSFAGYNSSFFSPLSAEVSAIWIGSYLGGHHTLPPKDEMLRQTKARLAWMRKRSAGHHARGTNVIPFSLHTIDEALNDVGLNVSSGVRAKQWLLPPVPADYRRITPRLARLLGTSRRPAAVARP